MRRGISTLGIIAPVFFALSVIVLGAIKPDYSHVYHTMSELGETGAVTAQAASIVFMVSGLMITVFGYAVQSELRRDDKRVWTGVMIMLFGLLDFVGSGVFPVDVGGASVSVVATVHVYATLLGELAAVGMPIWFLRDTEAVEGWEAHRRFSMLVFWASMPLVAFLGYCIVGHTPGLMDAPLGLAQRLLVGLFLVWIMKTAYSMRN
jgi:hypothetical membrane protein